MTDEPITFPDAARWYVKVLRFLNTLDDGHNMLSPVKINVWAANISALSTILASTLGWIHGHLGLASEVWTPVMTWLTHAHAAHHYDKKERNRTAIETLKATNK